MNLGKETEILEFKKSTGERIEAMDDVSSILNKHGHGTLYFGVSPNGDVVGQQVSAGSLNDVAVAFKDGIQPAIYPTIEEKNLDGKTVIKVTFSGKERPYSSFGRYYKRVLDRTEEMTPEELRRMMSDSDTNSYWENHLTDFGIEKVDLGMLKNFYEAGVKCSRMAKMEEYDPIDLLQRCGLFREKKLTNAGHFLFGNDGPIVLKMAVFATDERLSFIDIQRERGNILQLIDVAIKYVKSHINWSVKGLDGTRRVEVPEIPLDALREIVVNSFAHADYRSFYEHEIDITPTRVEIFNPGGFPQDFKPEDFVNESRRSYPRNRIILEQLYRCKDVEVFGSGLRKAYSSCMAAHVKVGYENQDDGFSFLFFRDKNVSENVLDNVSEKPSYFKESYLTTTEEKLLNLLKEKPTSTVSELAIETQRTNRTVVRSIRALKEKGFIRRIGSDRYGYWEIIQK